jgi:hypothetical protein
MNWELVIAHLRLQAKNYIFAAEQAKRGELPNVNAEHVYMLSGLVSVAANALEAGLAPTSKG